MARSVLVASAVLVLGLAGLVQAADKADPTGTWKWSTTFNNQARETTLKLKLDGDKLTGAVVGRNNQETAIEDAKFENGQVSFNVTRERGGQKFTTKYSGKLEGDTLKGTATSERDGQQRSRDWEAKREKA
jgi:hypothetical protein